MLPMPNKTTRQEIGFHFRPTTKKQFHSIRKWSLQKLRSLILEFQIHI